MVGGGIASGLSPVMAVLDIPFIFKDKALDGAGSDHDLVGKDTSVAVSRRQELL